jgi:hypothetical protein
VPSDDDPFIAQLSATLESARRVESLRTEIRHRERMMREKLKKLRDALEQAESDLAARRAALGIKDEN